MAPSYVKIDLRMELGATSFYVNREFVYLRQTMNWKWLHFKEKICYFLKFSRV